MTFSHLGANRKVVDNGLFYLNMHFQPNRDKSTRENGQKPSKTAKNGLKTDFSANLLENRSFSEHVTNRKVLDNGLFYLNIDFSQILSGIFEKSPKNPQKWLFLLKNCL